MTRLVPCIFPIAPRVRDPLAAVGLALMLPLALPGMALAQDAAAEATTEPASEAATAVPTLSVELNSAESVEGACRLTFLVQNGLGADLQQLALETVILTDEGLVERLTLFDFRDLPADRPRVRQFDLGGITCDGIGRVLINGVSSCTGDGVEPQASPTALTPSSRVETMEILG